MPSQPPTICQNVVEPVTPPLFEALFFVAARGSWLFPSSGRPSQCQDRVHKMTCRHNACSASRISQDRRRYVYRTFPNPCSSCRPWPLFLFAQQQIQLCSGRLSHRCGDLCTPACAGQGLFVSRLYPERGPEFALPRFVAA